MNNLKLTLAAVAFLAVSQSTQGNTSEFDMNSSPLITYDTDVSNELTKQVDTKVAELECLASVIYHEARGEPKKGKIAVGYVVLNRTKHKAYPSKICDVAFQKAQFTGLKKIKYDEKSMNIAFKVIKGKYPNPINKATHFHTTHVNPAWATNGKMKLVTQYGSHLFYRFA